MNLTALTVHMMLNLTGRWLSDAEFKAALNSAAPLGEGILHHLVEAHEPLAALQNNRRAAKVALRDLIDLASKLDYRHDQKARAIYYHLRGFIEGAMDPSETLEYRSLQALLFPDGLRVVNLPYIEEGGAAVALDRAVSQDLRVKLESIKVGEQSLGALFEDWIDAGHKLGKAAKDRAELEAALSKEGSAVQAIDVKAGRKSWVQAVEGLLWAIGVNAKLASLGESVTAALEQGIAISRRRWASGTADTDAEIDGDDEELADAAEAEAEAELDAEVDADVESNA